MLYSFFFRLNNKSFSDEKKKNGFDLIKISGVGVC